MRRRGPGDRPPPPPPEPQQAAQPKLCDKGRGGGGGAKGLPGSRRRPQRLDSAKMARGSAGSRRRRLGGTGPGLGRLPSSHSRGPLGPPPRPLGGRAHAQTSATTTPGKGALTKGREAPGRPAGGAGSPGAGGLRGSRVPRALGPRRAQASRTPPLSLGRRRHRLTLFATLPLSLSPSPEATEPGRCPDSPPLPRHHSPPPDSHPSLQSREISRLTGSTLREARLRTRARPHGSARVLTLGGVSRMAQSSVLSPVRPRSPGGAVLPRGRQVHSFHPEI